eukprot:TRINITY_DN5321_c0_g1_i14.p1 TRINITY_DN5321_c0_g1~~TRINITY_DN5321_c0_g1_i14.p1  ORF type:complete len:1000 (-),score=268.16 TRINITY_DN5321_c0_g1_i14:578-3577(-)
MIIVFLLQFVNFFMILLMAAGVLSLIAYGLDKSQPNNLYLGVVLFGIVLFTCLGTFYQEFQTNSVIASFNKMLPAACSVKRAGYERQLPASELVPGDIVIFRSGDKIPADLRIIGARSVKIERSSLTGEALPVVCSAQPSDEGVPSHESVCLAFNGSLCVEGSGVGVVIRTGDRTMIGKLAQRASQTTSQESTLQTDVKRFVYFISILAIAMATVFFCIGLGRRLGQDALNTFINGFLVVIVANVPQGLPATVVSLLTIVARRLSRFHVFVKRLDCVETLGSTTIIASDKTGTLTRNQMSVTAIWSEHQFSFGRYDLFYRDDARRSFSSQLSHSSRGSVVENIRASFDIALKEARQQATTKTPSVPMVQLERPRTDAFQPTNGLQRLYRCASLCNKAAVDRTAGDGGTFTRTAGATIARDVYSQQMKVSGSPSEVALLRWCESLRPSSLYRKSHPVLFEVPFASLTKWMAVVVKAEPIPVVADSTPSTEETDFLLLVKGAPERVIAFCSSYLSHDSVEKPMEDAFHASLDEAYRRFANEGQRVLGFAELRFKARADSEFTAETVQVQDMCFLGLTAIADPPRDDVPEAVAKCHTAGIKVFMVTGDHQLTAAAIARQVGIIRQQVDEDGFLVDATDGIPDWAVVSGAQLDSFSEDEWDGLLTKSSVVFARVTPDHKLQIVERCQKRGEVVTVTGDGVNDATALKKADTGVAMGLNGSDVAREAADVMLMDDNFASIVQAIQQGRLIFDNLIKTIAYTLTHLLPEIAPALINLSFGFPLGLTPLQVLSVDLLTEMGPAISLAYEDKESDIMDRPPRNIKKDRLVSGPLLIYSYLVAGLLETIACFLSYMFVYWDYGFSTSNLYFAADYYFKPDAPLLCVGGACYTAAQQLTIAAQAASSWYITLVFSQAFHIWVCRTRRASLFTHGMHNIVTIFGVLLSIALCLLIVYVPGVQGFFGSATVGWRPWIIALICGIVLISYSELRKWYARNYPESRLAGWLVY